MLIKVEKGKGDKQRVIPFSFALRKTLYRHIKTQSQLPSDFVFSTRSGAPQTYRNALRQLVKMGREIGIRVIRFHQLRHQFATNYLRTGGSVAMLRKILGHQDISSTLIYEHLQTDDLKNVHHRHSLLATLR
jgi:integrase/recombinase XerD